MKAIDVIKGALKLIGVQPAETDIEAVEYQDGILSLNDMMNEWDQNGIDIGFENLEDLQDELYVPDGTLGAIKANLAVYIAPEYARVVTEALALRARKGIIAVRAQVPIPSSQFPDSLPVGSGNETNRFRSSNGDVAGNRFNNRFFPANVQDKCN